MRHIFTLLLLLLVGGLCAQPQAPGAPPDQAIAGTASDQAPAIMASAPDLGYSTSIAQPAGGAFEILDAGMAFRSPAQGFPSVHVGSYVAEGASRSQRIALGGAPVFPAPMNTPHQESPREFTAASRCTGGDQLVSTHLHSLSVGV